ASIRLRHPEIEMVGIGGDGMEAAGVQLIEHINKLAVFGFVVVIAEIPHHWQLLRKLKKRFKSGTVGLAILVDYAGFNLLVAKAAHEAKVPVLFYVTPQVWASRAGRMRKLARYVTKAACILQFEEALLRKNGIDATFVGHPILDRADTALTQLAARELLHLPAHGEILALFPGSRRSELRRHLDVFVATAMELKRRRPSLRVVVATAPTIAIDSARCPFQQVSGNSFAVLRAATAGLLKSGTATLEATVAGLPHVVAYRTGSASYQIAKRVITISHIGMVNIIAGRQVAREFIQDALVPSTMADALSPLLDTGSVEHRAAVGALAEVSAQLGTAGAADRVADMALEMLA
ncbi:MAG: lipid-A-disaccharide synthase, partial [Gemmatimonadota bacterium]|nr:lipid-A-disaccharide synthase [Gemmatimonadota bacterium]